MDNTAIVAVCLGAAFFLIIGASLLWPRKRQERVAERMRENCEIQLAMDEKVRVTTPPASVITNNLSLSEAMKALEGKKRGRPKGSKNKPRKHTVKRPKKKKR